MDYDKFDPDPYEVSETDRIVTEKIVSQKGSNDDLSLRASIGLSISEMDNRSLILMSRIGNTERAFEARQEALVDFCGEVLSIPGNSIAKSEARRLGTNMWMTVVLGKINTLAGNVPVPLAYNQPTKHDFKRHAKPRT